jgi:hypothetical protein
VLSVTVPTRAAADSGGCTSITDEQECWDSPIGCHWISGECFDGAP